MKRLIALCALICMIPAAAAAGEEKKDGTGGKEFVSKLVEDAFSPVSAILGGSAELGRIVVTPSRFGESAAASSSSISVVDADDFARREVTVAKNALEGLPGVDIRQSGSFQGTTSLIIRGAKPSHTLVLIDGMKAYDPISIDGSYDLSHLVLDNIDRIEVLRGSQSSLYGSDAIGGVVNVISKRAEKPYMNLAWEGGSFYTFREQFEMGSADHGFHYAIAASRLDTKGVSQAQAKKDCQERDPYDRTNIAASAEYEIGEAGTVGATFRYVKGHYAYDQGADADDDNAFGIYRDTFATVYGSYRLIERWEQTIRLGWMETQRLYFDDDGYADHGAGVFGDFDRSKYTGRTFKLDYEHIFTLCEADTLVGGYEHVEEIGDYYSQNDYSGAMGVDDMPKVFDRSDDLYIENRFNLADRLTSTQGMRVTHHSRAGTCTTYRFDAGYLFQTGTKVRGLVATGFKAPSLFQLYAPANAWFGGGDPDLRPEKSFSYEYGVDQYLWGDKLTAGVTYFHSVYRDLIDSIYNPTTYTSGQYTNFGKCQVHGIECEMTVRPTETLRLTGAMTLQGTKDFQNDQEMIRRPKQKCALEVFWQATKKLSLDCTIRYNGPMADNLASPGGANTYKVKAYTVIDAVVNYDLTKNVSVYLRTENLMNKSYEDVRGYTAPPFSLYGGAKAKF